MVAPSYISSTAGATTTGQANVTATWPTGKGTGKVYMICYANSQTAGWNTPAGWSIPTVVDGTPTFDNTVRSMAVFEHPGDGTEGNDGTTFTVTRNTNLTAVGGVILIRVSKAGTLQSIRLSSGAGATTINLAARTAANADTLALQAVAYATAGAGSWSPPAGTTENNDVSSNPGAVQCAVGTDVVAAGSSGDRTWTRASSGASRGAMLLINPLPGVQVTRWNGSAEVPVTVTRWNGSAEVPVTIKRWNGSAELP